MAELVETPQAHDQRRKGRGRCGRHRPEPGRQSLPVGVHHCWRYPPPPLPQVCQELAQGAVVTLYYNPDDPAEMYVEGDKSVLGAEVLYVVLGIVLLVLMAGIVR